MALPADYQQILDEEFEVSGFYEYSHGIGIASSSQGVWLT
jgi:hypothetical protein